MLDQMLEAFDVHITLRHNGLCLADSACQTDKDYTHYNVIEAHKVCIRDYGTLVDNLTGYRACPWRYHNHLCFGFGGVLQSRSRGSRRGWSAQF